MKLKSCLFFYEASLQGQFRDEEEFRVVLEKFFSARRRSPCFENMRTTHALADRKVLHSRSFRQVVQSWRGMTITRLVMAWVAKNGPFIENDRTPEEEDLFYCLGVEVTDGGLGEAARRTKASEDVASVSLHVNLLSKVAFFSCPIMTPPLRDGRTVGEEPQPDQPAGRTIPILSMLIIPGCLSIATR